jgi:hypothetical protein
VADGFDRGEYLLYSLLYAFSLRNVGKTQGSSTIDKDVYSWGQ